MFDLIKLRREQGRQYIKDIAGATVSQNYRGFPLLDETLCNGCRECVESCPTGAVTLDRLKIDMGRCVFCGVCEAACPTGAIRFSNEHRLAATSREALIVASGSKPTDYLATAVRPRKELKRIFGGSLRIRSVSAGGCNGCELELAATTNVNFDAARFGIDIVASPRHADVVVITGPISANMATALEATVSAVPAPKLTVLMGVCAISGGVFAGSPALSRDFLKNHTVDLYVPGSPPHPLALVHGLLSLLGRRGFALKTPNTPETPADTDG
ncbi:MAG TPA: 4Fe-4S binding protein [Spirochaetia bacterium]|nr:4Fe-4S binding protein [Spirochaetia bacterium]